MNAVVYGAGNIGRGFVGAMMAQSGYSVAFVDVSQPLVESINEARSYPLRIVSSGGHEDLEIAGVRAINGNDLRSVAEAIAHADIAATAVGANALPLISASIAAGLRMRWGISDAPLDILICENLMDADSVFAKLLKEQLVPSEYQMLDERVGLVETSIGRMVPVQMPEMQDGNPLRICVERYGFLPVDGDAFKGDIPPIENLIPFTPFGYYKKRKLCLHNMGHAVCAYLGSYAGREYIHEALAEPYICLIVKEAMLESMLALADEYAVPMREIHFHCDDLLFRFANKALGDTCARVGSDHERKLHNSDRLIGAALLCEKHGYCPAYVAVGTAAALYCYLNEKEQMQNGKNAQAALSDLSSLAPQSRLGALILEFYGCFRRGADLEQLFFAAQAIKKSFMPEII